MPRDSNDAHIRLFRRFQRRPGRRRLEALVRAYHDHVYRVALRLSGNDEDARDLTQDLFLSLITNPPPKEAKEIRSPRGFLAYRVLSLVERRDRAAGRRRKREREATRRLRDSHGLDAAEVEEIRERIRELPKGPRAAIEMRYLAGLNNREVSDVLQISERSVERLLRQGREILRTRLGRVFFGALAAVEAAGPTEAVAASTQLLENVARVLEVAPGLGATLGARSATASGTSKAISSLSIGVTVMKLKSSWVAIGITACLLIGSGIATRVWISDEQIKPPKDESIDIETVAISEPPTADASDETVSDTAVPTRSEPATPIEEKGTTIYGHVRNAETREVVVDALVYLLDSRRQTRSGAQGEFEFVGVDASKDRLAARKGNALSYSHADDIEKLELKAGEPNGPFEVLVYEGLSLMGQVYDRRTGEPIEGAIVAAGRQRRHYDSIDDSEAGTDADGFYRVSGLPAGKLDVDVSAPGYAESLLVAHVTDESETVLDVPLDPAIKLAIQVVDENESPLEGAAVIIRKQHPVGGWSYPGAKLQTDASGSVVTRGHGPLRVEVKMDGYADGGVELDLRDDPSRGGDPVETLVTMKRPRKKDSTKYFAGVVTDVRGQPIEGVTVSWARIQSFGSEEAALTAADGRYLLEVEPIDYPQFNQLGARKDRHAPAWKRNLAPGSREAPTWVDFMLSGAHWLAGRVVDASGEPLSEIRVRVKPHPDPGTNTTAILTFAARIPGQADWIKTDEDGRFRFDDLPGRKLFLDFYTNDYSTRANVQANVDEEIEVVLLPRGAFRGRVVDRISGEAVTEFRVKASLDAGFQSQGQFFSSPDGRFEIDNLPMGKTFDVWVEVEGYPGATKKGAQPFARGSDDEFVFELVASELRGIVVDGRTALPVVGAAIYSANLDRTTISWDYFLETRDRRRNFQETRTDAEGVFVINEGAELGWIFVSAPGYARQVLSPAGRPEVNSFGLLEVSMEPAGTIRGKMRGETAEWVKDVDIEQEKGHYRCEVPVDEERRFRMDHLASGPHVLRWGWGVEGGSCILRRRVELEAGETKEVELGYELGPLILEGEVTGCSLDGDDPSAILMKFTPQFEGFFLTLEFMARGRTSFRIPGFHRGSYTVEMESYFGNRFGQKSKSSRIDIVQSRELDLEFVPAD